MNRQQVIAALADFAGPLGPFESWDEQLDRRDAWLAGAGPELADLLLDVLVNPPSNNEFSPVTRENFEGELSEMLSQLGQRDPSHSLDKIGAYLTNEHARPTIIEVIGGLGLPAGVDLLKPLLSSARLTDDELVRLAGALGEIGGPEAHALLYQMRNSYPPEMTDLQKEIDIALQSAESDRTT